jgi:hypothetical protein
MYFFVRFHGFMTIFFGILVMVFGVAGAIYGFAQNVALVELVNRYLLAGTYSRLLDARIYVAALGLILFLLGLSIAAGGQLLVVFADMAANTRETKLILRSIRREAINPVVYAPEARYSAVQSVEASHSVESPAGAPSPDLPPAS